MDISRRDKQAWLDEYDRRHGLRSLYHFGRHVVGYDLEDQTHGELCSILDTQANRQILLLMPRGSFKTSVATQLYATQRLIQNPNLRILLDSEVLQNSQNNLGVVKRLFESHPRVRSIWGDFTSKTWTQDFITVGKRTNLTLKEPSVTASSIETVQVGPHYDEIICDDLHSEKNTKTIDQVEWVVKHFRLLFSLLEPGGRIIVIGTRWSDFDLYGRIIEDLPEFRVLHKAAHNSDGSLFFPQRLTQEFLDSQRKILGSDLYNSQYENNPLPSDENARFKKGWFKYYRTAPSDLDIYIAVDPALPGSNKQDYFGIVVGGINRNNELYILDTVYGHWEPYEGIDKIFMLAAKYKHRGLKSIGIETNVFQRLIKYQFEAEMRKRGKFYKVEEVKHYSESKQDRILSLQPRYECGAVFHHESMRDGELEEELLKFPRGKKKDLADAAATLLEVAKIRIVRKNKVIQKFPTSSDELIARRLQYLHDNRKRFVHPTLGVFS